jgi:hypothetical protein
VKPGRKASAAATFLIDRLVRGVWNDPDQSALLARGAPARRRKSEADRGRNPGFSVEGDSLLIIAKHNKLGIK